MVSLTKFFVVLLLVLPCLLVDAKKSTQCSVAVSQTLTSTSSSGKTNTYTATVTNVGTTTASAIVLTASNDIKSATGLDQSDDDQYTPSSQQTLAPGASFTFTYSVKASSNVQWTATCTGTATPTAAPSSPTAPSKTSTTKAATPKPTSAPTAASTTTKATTKPTTAPTSAPTSGSSSTNGAKTCSSGWWRPAPGTTWQWQLTGTIDTSFDVQMYDIDMFDNTADTIATLHAAGRTVICYFSTQYENWRPDAASFTSAVLGNNLDDWAGEKYVDIRSTVVRNIMTSRLDIAVSKGCDGVEPDNVDGYEASTGFPLTAADQLNFNEFIAAQAHARGLSVGLKNDVDQASTLQPYFDWALNEQCNQYSECTTLNSFISAGKAVFNCEYSGSASSVCPKMVTAKFSTIFKALSLEAAIKTQCCTYATGGCATKPAHSCVSTSSKRQLVADSALNNVADEVSGNMQEAQDSSATTTYASIVLVGLVAVAALL